MYFPELFMTFSQNSHNLSIRKLVSTLHVEEPQTELLNEQYCHIYAGKSLSALNLVFFLE